MRLAGLYVDAGYAVLVPERRGYGNSDGATFSDAIGRDRSARFIARLQEETDDVLAAADFLRTVSFSDTGRLGIAGHSFGGIVTLFAIARSRAFRAAIDEAGGMLNWRSLALQSALADAARAATCPVFLMAAQNDAAPESITVLAQVMTAAGVQHKKVLYPPFTPSVSAHDMPPGHLLFTAEGIPVWGGDAVAFFDSYLKSPGLAPLR